MMQSSKASPQAQARSTVTPDLWLVGAATAIGVSVWAYDKHWQPGALAGLVALPLLGLLYPLPAWLFGWPKARGVDVLLNGLDLLDMVLGLLSIFA